MGWLKKLFGTAQNAGPNDERSKAKASSERLEFTPLVTFQPLNELERLLMEAATNVDAREPFERALLQAELYAATPDAPEVNAVHTTVEGEQIELLNVQSPDGASVAAIFTSQERIVEFFDTGVGFIAIRGGQLLAIVARQGAWLNSGLAYSVYWTPDQLAALLGMPEQRTVPENTKILLGSPSVPPDGLIAELKRALGNDSRIVEAWFALAQWPDGDKSSWYLDVRTNLEAEAVHQLFAETFKHADYAGRTLDLVVSKPNGEEGIGIRLVPTLAH